MVKLYVEGGGETAALKTACREGFCTFITNAGVTRRPRIVACGSRRDAYESFCTALANGEDAMLLVDSESAIAAAHYSDASPDNWLPWSHLKARPGDGWEKPKGSDDKDCHLMTQVMESWFIADAASLKKFFGQGFKPNALPAQANTIEQLPKATIYDALKKATDTCKTKSEYGKGEHSFKLLAIIDPAKVIAASAWAKRFIDTLQRKMKI